MVEIRARDYRTPGQPQESCTPWGMWIEVTCGDGTSALIRGTGCSETQRPGHPFWVHGSKGTLRGSVLGQDFLELEQDGTTERFDLDGGWFPDGFAGTMGELMCAIEEDREPYNSGGHNLLTLEITLAACRSADSNGVAVALPRGA